MNKVEKIVHKNIKKLTDNKKVKKLSNDMKLKEDLGLGSMTLVALFTNLTDSFKLDLLQFDDSDLTDINSVQDLVDLFEIKTININK
ncbi:MAG: acyl carrier protein [Cyclobacteriaceae bacterium]|jgi:acyl carrier protein